MLDPVTLHTQGNQIKTVSKFLRKPFQLVPR